MVSVTPAMGRSADGLASDVEWQVEEGDDGPVTEVRTGGEPFTVRSARQVQRESDLEPPEDPEWSLPGPEEGAPSSRLR
jgi:hypothetical protein